MTNNIELFKNYLNKFFPELNKDPDMYFVIELIRRGKDNPTLPAANYKFKTYYINTLSDIDRFEDEIIKCCDMLRLRAYFSINKKSYYQVMLDASSEYSRRLAHHDHKKPYSIWESCSGSYLCRNDKKWVIDLDEGFEEEDYLDLIGKDKILFRLPTRSGIHLIVTPFNLKKFWEDCEKNGFPRPNILRNHLSLLYENL